MNALNQTNILSAAVLAASLCVAPLAAQNIQSYHGANSAQHQAHFNNYSNLGYRMVDLTIYGSVANPTYAAVWAQIGGPAFTAIHDATAAQYQNFVDTWAPQGYLPTIVASMGTAGNPRFAAVMEQRNVGIAAYHGLTQGQLWTTRNTEAGNGNQILAIDVYGTAADPRYIVSFAPDTVGQGISIATNYTDYQEDFDAMVEGHARQSVFCVNDDHSRIVSLWRSDYVGDWVSHGNLTGAQYQALAVAYDNANLKPISLDASGPANNPRFAAVWAPSLTPIMGGFTATGPSVPALSAFDDWARNWMEDNEVYASSLCVVKDGRLVLARGYTLADANYPITQPTSLFELASTTKPLTSIAVHQHFENPASGLAPGNGMMSYFPGLNPQDNRCNNTTVYDLLTHQGGWNRNISPDPMVFSDETIAAALNIPLPIDKSDILQYMIETQNMDFAPGTQSQYSNFGYSVLGQIIERVNPGFTYAQIMQRDVFAPLGITRAKIGGSTFAQQDPNQVRSHLYDPWLQASVMSPLQPAVAAQYGDLNYPNMDSHGAWIMAAPDFAKILAAFDFGAGNPLLGEDATDDMWTVAPGTNSTMSGWFLTNVQDDQGNPVRMMQHNGRLLGSTAFIGRREDGLSFVFFANGDKRNMTGGNTGTPLSDIANTIPIWPNHDLFPQMRLPGCRQHRDGITRVYGRSCDGGRQRMVLDATGIPEIGQPMSFRLRYARPNAPAYLMIGFQTLFVDLGVIGAPTCTLYVNPEVTVPGTTDAVGHKSFPWLVPDIPAAVGFQLFSQAAVVDPFENALGVVTTNRLDVTLGGWF